MLSTIVVAGAGMLVAILVCILVAPLDSRSMLDGRPDVAG